MKPDQIIWEENTQALEAVKAACRVLQQMNMTAYHYTHVNAQHPDDMVRKTAEARRYYLMVGVTTSVQMLKSATADAMSNMEKYVEYTRNIKELRVPKGGEDSIIEVC